MAHAPPHKITMPSDQTRGLTLLVGLLVALVWSYYRTIDNLVAFWMNNEDYSVGMLVPLAALYLVWSQRERLRGASLAPAPAALALLLGAQVLRLASLYFGYESVERGSLVLSIWAVVWLACGWTVMRRMFWVLLFLLLMVPLPGRIHNLIALPLQDYATSLAVFGLELCGYLVTRDGNVLHLDGQNSVMVAEACSGLRMLMAFIFTAALLAFFVARPAWVRAVLVLSSVPVALLCNGLRVFATSIAVAFSDSPAFETQFHDWAGLIMMPIAIALLLAELRLIDALVADPPADKAKTKAAPQRVKEQTA